MSAPVCIWCLKPSTDSDKEHIFPEALGCPPELMLPGHAVCRKCNNDLAHLDLAVIDDFDFSRFLYGIPRKKNRPPEISGRGNVYGYVGQSGPEIYFNVESRAVTLENGRRIAPYRNNPRDVKPSTTIDGQTMKVNFSVPFGHGKKFLRGITKIAFSAFCFRSGQDKACSNVFDSVRSFVRHGSSNRRILVSTTQDNKIGLVIAGPWCRNTGDYCIQVDMLGASFLVDLSHRQTTIAEIEGIFLKTHGPSGWTVLGESATNNVR